MFSFILASSMNFDLLLCYLRFRRGGGYAALLRCWIKKYIPIPGELCLVPVTQVQLDALCDA